MQIVIDGDGCPVVDITLEIGREFALKCFIFCDEAHFYDRPYAEVITLTTGSDSVDFAILNFVKEGDVVITQDYGLAAMCLGKKALVINQNGMVYDDTNIDQLLMQRHQSRMARRKNKYLKGPKKRNNSQNKAFANNFRKLLLYVINDN